MKKKWAPDAALVKNKKLEKEDETHADGMDLKQQAKDQSNFQGATAQGEELAAIESELDKTAQWEAELKAKQDALLATRNNALQDDIDTKARRKKERYQRLWGPILILYPTFHAGLAIFTVFVGNIAINATCVPCTYPLDAFIGAAIGISYIFMLVFTWVLIGPRPIRSFKTLFTAYGILFGVSFCVYGAGTGMVLISGVCAETTPGLYYLSFMLMVIYWISALAFSGFALHTHIKYKKMVKAEAAAEDADIQAKKEEVTNKQQEVEKKMEDEQAARDAEFGSSSSEDEDDNGSNVPKHMRTKDRKAVKQKGVDSPAPPPPSGAPPPEDSDSESDSSD